jgi:hypothetical protein
MSLSLPDKKFPYPALPYANGSNKNYVLTALQDISVFSIKTGVSFLDSLNVNIDGPRMKIILEKIRQSIRQRTGASCEPMAVNVSALTTTMTTGTATMTMTTGTATMTMTTGTATTSVPFRLGYLNFEDPITTSNNPDKTYTIPEIVELSQETFRDWAVNVGLPSDIEYNKLNVLLRRQNKRVYIQPRYGNTFQDPLNLNTPPIKLLLAALDTYASRYLEIFQGIKFVYSNNPTHSIPLYISEYTQGPPPNQLPVYVGTEANQPDVWSTIKTGPPPTTQRMFDNSYQQSLELPGSVNPNAKRFAFVTGTNFSPALELDDYIFRYEASSNYSQAFLASYIVRLGATHVITIRADDSSRDAQGVQTAASFDAAVASLSSPLTIINIPYRSESLFDANNLPLSSAARIPILYAYFSSIIQPNIINNNNGTMTLIDPLKGSTYSNVDPSKVVFYFSSLNGNELTNAFVSWITQSSSGISTLVNRFRYIIANATLLSINSPWYGDTSLADVPPTGIPGSNARNQFMAEHGFFGVQSEVTIDPVIVPLFPTDVLQHRVTNINSIDSQPIKYQKYYRNLFMALQRSNRRQDIIDNVNTNVIPNIPTTSTPYIVNVGNGTLRYRPGGYIDGGGIEQPTRPINAIPGAVRSVRLGSLGAINNVLSPPSLINDPQGNAISPATVYDIKGALYRQSKLTTSNGLWTVFDKNQQNQAFQLTLTQLHRPDPNKAYQIFQIIALTSANKSIHKFARNGNNVTETNNLEYITVDVKNDPNVLIL